MSDVSIQVEISGFAVMDDGLIFNEEVQTEEGNKK
jgi:hypothetical protein